MSEPTNPNPKETKFPQGDQSIIDDILKEMPSNDAIEVDLPSKNRFYTLQDPSMPITMRPMSFADEKSMLSKKDGGSDIINKLLARCVTNIDIAQLLQMDKLYMLMKLREISYGPNYHVTINCPSCKSENNVVFALDTFNVNYADEELTNPMKVQLPILKKEVVVKIPRVEDERYFTNSETTLNNLWRFIVSIGGYDAKSVISKVVPQLPIKDAHIIMEALGCTNYGIDTNVRFACSYCDHVESMELPITADFFSSK